MVGGFVVVVEEEELVVVVLGGGWAMGEEVWVGERRRWLWGGEWGKEEKEKEECGDG